MSITDNVLQFLSSDKNVIKCCQYFIMSNVCHISLQTETAYSQKSWIITTTTLNYMPLLNKGIIFYQKLHLVLKNLLCIKGSGGQSTQIKYLSKSTDTYSKILLQ